jgi:Flp pilus assembly pilin Flp
MLLHHALWYFDHTEGLGGRVGRMREQRGAALVEWALLVILIAIVALVTVKLTGAQHSELWSQIGQSIAAA